MNTRLLVMNGQCIVQKENENEWATERVEKAGAVKPGIYNLYLAKSADKRRQHHGPVIYIDKDHIFQQIGKDFVRHLARDFATAPEVGNNIVVSYSGDRAIATNNAIKTGRRI